MKNQTKFPDIILMYRRDGHTTNGVAKYILNLFTILENGELHHAPIKGMEYDIRKHGVKFRGDKEAIKMMVSKHYNIIQIIEL